MGCRKSNPGLPHEKKRPICCAITLVLKTSGFVCLFVSCPQLIEVLGVTPDSVVCEGPYGMPRNESILVAC